MKQKERRVSPGATGPLSCRPSQAEAKADFAWPPSDEDLAGCGVILIDGDGPREVDLRVAVHVSPAAHAPRFRHWGVEHPEAAYPFHVESDKPVPGASSAGEVLRAVLALAAGLSLAVLSYAQFRGARGELPVPELTAAIAPAAPLDPRDVEPVADAPDENDVVEDSAPQPPTAQRRRGEDRGVLAAARPALAALAASVLEEAPRPEALAAPAIPALAGPHEEPAAVVTAPAPIAVVERAAAPEPTAVAAVHVDRVPADEDHIRAALTRWRTAYSALDASAAREVWPSVDARALERAFQALKSQELRFDRCDLTVNGGSAQAACTGQAIYVPRVGNQSPRAMPHEWTFELRKSDQRWTIASARSS